MQLSECIIQSGNDRADLLVARIEQKKELLDAGDPAHKEIKTALVIGAGAMRGVYSGGVVTGLEELGYTDVFDVVVGVSAGACTAAYFLAGQAELGTTIYYEELAGRDFIDLRRRGNMLNIAYLGDVFRTSKPLDQVAIRASRSDFYIGVTDVEKAQAEYVPMNHANDNDIIKFLQASSSVPGAAPPVEIEGTLYGDGITACTNPINFVTTTLGCTDVLYITNQPLRRRASISSADKVISKIATRSYSQAFQAAFQNRHNMSDESADKEYPDTVNVGIICPSKMPMHRLSTNATQMKKIAEQARQQTVDIFTR